MGSHGESWGVMGSHGESLGVIGEHGKARVVEEMHILLSVSPYVRE